MILDYLIAIASGLLAGVSPCSVPIYPALLNNLTRSREDPKWVTVFFTVGLAGVYFLVYSVLGLVMALAGAGLVETVETWRGRLTLVGALFSWLMAAATLHGGLRIPTIRLFKTEVSGGYAGALFSGFVYGSMVTPCNAPFIFTGILPALASSRSVFEGILLLLLFSVSLGAPFLFLGWVSGAAILTFKALERNARKLEVASAVFLILAGFYFLYLFALTLY